MKYTRKVKIKGSDEQLLYIPISGESNEEEPSPTVDTHDNHIYVYGEINISSMQKLIRTASKINNENTYLQKSMWLKQKPPIIIHINSNGGDISAAFGATDMIRRMKTNVITIAEGTCASAATILLLCGNTRCITQNSHIMIHEITSTAWGNLFNIETESAQLKQVREQIINYYTSTTTITRRMLETKIANDWWINANEAKKLNIIDVII